MLRGVRIGEGEGRAEGSSSLVMIDRASFFGSQTVHVGVSREWVGEVLRGGEFRLFVFLRFDGVVLFYVAHVAWS